MTTKAKQISLLLSLGVFLLSATGCAAVRAPWLAKKEDTSSMDSYVAQADSDIQYDTDVDFASDYQPPAQPVSNDTAPPARSASQSSGGSCCN